MSNLPDPGAPSAGGLTNVVDIIVAPQAAFARLRVVPAWGWAFLTAALMGIAGMLLMEPAFAHAFEKSAPALYAATPAIANLPPEKRPEAVAAMMRFGRTVTQYQWLAVPFGLLLGALLSAIVMLIVNTIGDGEGTFAKYYALAMTTAVVSTLGLLLTGIVTTLRGPDSFDTLDGVSRALPSLATFVPGASGRLATFLAALNVTALWASALQALGTIAIGRVAPALAWTGSAAVLVGAAALAASFAQ